MTRPRLGSPSLTPPSLSCAYPAISCAYPVTIDYGESLGRLISKGQYKYTNPDISEEHFPIHGVGKAVVDIVLSCFGPREVTSREARAIAP